MDKTLEEIEVWLIAHISKGLGIDAQRIDVNLSLARYGLDSIVAIELTADLEDWLERPIPETLLWDEPTIRAIALHLSGEKETADTDRVPAQKAGSEISSAKFPNKQAPTKAASANNKSDLQSVGFFNSAESIAIIGMGCRLPGAKNPEAFWQLLRNGLDAIVEVPPERWDAENFYDPDPSVAGKMMSRWGGFLTDIDLFDPQFFGISPREATHMDPQQRLLLEVTWEALEHAGLVPDTLAGSQTGVFTGISTNDYSKSYFSAPNSIDAYTNIGNAHSITASRLSYLLDLHGPSMAIDTACSSSLVAIHLACQSLRSGETTLALAGGVNAILSPDATISFSKARIISADRHCKPFDASADGLVRGEGCGIVILKRLSDAQADGNRILAVIRGSAVNQDGRGNGLTAPNPLAQQAVIRQALKQAGITPAQLGYVVAQGTGTPLGDAVEFQALQSVLADQPTTTQRCALSSVKANIGHLEAAAGVASVIAAIQSLQHEEIAPQLHFQRPNLRISLEHTSLCIPTEVQAWPKGDQSRFVGVSAFSISGTNAHLVLEEAPVLPQDSTFAERPMHLLTLSASNKRALTDLVKSYEHYLATPSSATLSEMCFTTNTGRTHFSHRLAAIAETREGLLNSLRTFATDFKEAGLFSGQRAEHDQPKVAFLLSGEGTEYEHMGYQLYETQPVFRAAFDQCADILEIDLEQPLLSVLHPAPGIHSPLHKSTYAQPALFALEYAQAALWRSWGIVPDAVMGYGVGAYVAAHLAGALSLEDALKLVIECGQLVQKVPQVNVALMIHASEAQVAEVLIPYHQHASIVAIHAPNRIVINSTKTMIEQIQEVFSSRDIVTSSVSFSYTSSLSLSTTLLGAFERVAKIIPHEKLSVPFISTLTGQRLSPGEMLRSDYWVRHICEPIRFADGIDTLSQEGCQFFIELGPSSLLSEMGRELMPEEKGTWLPCLSQKQANDWQGLLIALGTLYVNGRDINWTNVDEGIARQVVSLPTYPFQRERYWITPAKLPRSSEHTQMSAQATKRHPLLGRPVR